MEPIIIAAIIGAVGTVTATVLAIFFRRKPRKQDEEKKTPPNSSVVANGIHAAGDVILSGRDMNITQQGKDRFITRESEQLISRVADQIIRDRKTRFDWSSSDVNFLDACVRDTPRGWIFDGKASQGFLKWENDEFFNLSVRIYNEVCKQLGYSHADYKNLALVEEAYLTSRYKLRGLTIMKHPKKEPTIDELCTLWDGSELGWCMVGNVGDKQTEKDFSPIIFNRLRNGVLSIDDASLHRNVIERMKKLGIPVFNSLEDAVMSKNENNIGPDDATALINCECGAMIMVSTIPVPTPRHLRVRCSKCGTEKVLDLDDFSVFRVEE
ncbi:MAG: hypothetical protein FVQ84_07570 [Planctomycetes bacterium]|nr:hypothetical protein [Planctomycetota bacterium]